MTAILARILAEHGVSIVPTSRRRGEGETHAGGILRQILVDHGPEHLRLTLSLIRGSARNREALSSEIIAAVSDVLAQRPEWHTRASELAAATEAIDLEALRRRAVMLRPWPVRGTLRAFLYVQITRSMDRSNWSPVSYGRIAA